jgi:hypothetical protein
MIVRRFQQRTPYSMKTVAHSFAAFDDDRITDQRGTVRTLSYDLLGRLTDDSISTVGGSTDSTVLRISMAESDTGTQLVSEE